MDPFWKYGRRHLKHDQKRLETAFERFSVQSSKLKTNTSQRPENLITSLSSFKIPSAKSIYLRYLCLALVLLLSCRRKGKYGNTRLSNKGQIVIPKRIRATHGWEPGLEFIVEDTGDGIKLKPVIPFLETKAEELLGCVGCKGPKKSLKEMEAAIAKGGTKENMIAVDTNLLVRILTNDDPIQARRAVKILIR